MDDKQDDTAFGFEIGPDRASAKISNQALGWIGRSAAWLAPIKTARSKITSAVAERVCEKIKRGESLNSEDLALVARVFEKEARVLENTEHVAEKVRSVLPEVHARLAQLPELADSTTSTKVFVSRSEALAGEVSEDDVRDLFARVLAGEIIRPGSFSLRTLGVIRSLDPELAKAFQLLCNYVIDNEFVIFEEACAQHLGQRGLGKRLLFELMDAGLVSNASIQVPDDDYFICRYGDSSARVRCAEETLLTRGKARVSYDIDLLRLTRPGREIAPCTPLPAG